MATDEARGEVGSAAHPPHCLTLVGEPVGHEPHFLDGTCDCLCSACMSSDGLLCICPECKGDECPDNIWQREREARADA